MQPRARIMLRFAVYTAAVVVLAGVSLLAFLRNEVTRRTERSLAEQSQFLAETSLRHALHPADFTAPVTGRRLLELDRFFRDDVLAKGVVRVKLWAPDGVVTYSNDHSLIGARADDPDEIGEAIAGEQQHEVGPLNSEGGRGRDIKALSVYTPFRLRPGSRAIGVFESYHDYAPVAAAVRTTLTPVAAALALTLLALYISLFPILRRVTRMLATRNRHLSAQKEQLDRALADQREAEKALVASKQTLESLVNASPVGIIVLDAETRVLSWNRAAEQIFGWSEAEVLGRPNPLIAEEERDAHRARVGEAMRGKTMTAKEARRLRKDGSFVDVLVSTAPLTEPDGRITSVIGVLADVSERKRAEEQARDAEARFKTLVEQLPLAVYTKEIGTHGIAYVSPQIEEIVGYSVEEWTADPDFFTRRLHPEDRERVLAGFGEMYRSGEPYECDYRLIARDGRVVWCHDHAILVRDQLGRTLYAQGCLVDVSARREVEEALRERDEQLRQSQKLEAVGQLAGGIAHDFNNMMTAVVGYSDLILARLEPDHPLRAEIEEIRRAGERATTLTNQLLAFSRKQILQPRVLDVNAVIADTKVLLRHLIGEDIELVSTLAPELRPVEVDPGQLEQVIVNLAINARDAMPFGGLLELETANVVVGRGEAPPDVAVEPGAYVVLSVSDTGIGMDAETREHIFEPFFTTKAPGKGTGLGLATVFGIVKQHGGAISVDSEPDRGTTFRIYLPQAGRPAAAVPEREPSRPAPSGGSATILLVEDEQVVRHFERAVLEDCGYTVLEAESPERAVELSANHAGEIHLLLTDVVMPGMGGRELVETLTPSRPEMKVLYASGYTKEHMLRQGVLTQRVAFLQKPVTPASLARKVGEMLTAPRAALAKR